MWHCIPPLGWAGQGQPSQDIPAPVAGCKACPQSCCFSPKPPARYRCPQYSWHLPHLHLTPILQHFFPRLCLPLQSTVRYSSHAQKHEWHMQESNAHSWGWGMAPALPFVPPPWHLKKPTLCKAGLIQQVANVPGAQLCCQQDPAPLTPPCIGHHRPAFIPKQAEKVPRGQDDSSPLGRVAEPGE